MSNIVISFPDGKSEEFSKGSTVLEIAEKIGPRLAMAAVAARVNGALVDISYKIDSDSQLQILTGKDKDGLDVIRHSAAHLFAQALLRMFPECKLTIGPVVDEGFYYDIDSDISFSPTDFPAIEAEMDKIVREDLPVYREELSKHDALKLFATNEYKVEMINELPEHEKISMYKQGEFFDLCRGPHVPRTSRLKAVKLSKVAGAYWRADVNNKQLKRIYGYAFAEKKDLDAHLKFMEEAEKRDHRKIGKEQGLFVFSDLVGSGLPLWTPKGTLLRNLLDDYIWSLRSAKGYSKVCIPHLTKKELYETSGHWQKYQDDLFKTVSREGHMFAIKPMNCPHHTQIFCSEIRSYRDMPHRYSETTMCYRDEQSGELSGLSRVRGFTQDDAHVFCRQIQIKEEFLKIWDIVDKFYSTFGYNLRVRLSLHDPNNMQKYLGNPERWHKAEGMIREMAIERGADYFEALGEAAFYGPKIDFMSKDSLGREWQVATIQLDMNMPESFDLYCINESGEKERIVMIHAAIMGSIERFLSILIEHLAGKFPLWLSPVQIKLLPIADRHIEYCQGLKAEMELHGIRVEIDERTESTPKKVRDAQLMNIPLMITVGDKEIENHTLAVRTLDGKVKFGVTKEAFVQKIVDLVKNKSLTFEI
jgi:threonyl-tRNA synthetase